MVLRLSARGQEQFALDNISKTVGVLADMQGVPAGVATARDGLAKALPNLVDVRDTAHHVEDRARGLDKKKRPLMVNMIGLSNLSNNLLGYTTSDGHYHEVEISTQSVAAAQNAIQQTLDAFTWRGPSRTVPS